MPRNAHVFIPGFAMFNIKTDITHVSEAAASLSPLCGSRGVAPRFRICSRKVRISISTARAVMADPNLKSEMGVLF